MRTGAAAAPTGPWIRNFGSRGAPRTRLVCFPHSGGSASFYRTWGAHLPADCELWAIQYPGREDRIQEPLIDDMSALATAVTQQLLPRTGVPMVLFGHSMGASVAYEVARRMAYRSPGSVAHLAVSGREAPHRQQAVPEGEMTHLLGDREIVARLTELGGSNTALWQDPELRSLLLPAVRNDYRLIESYRPTPGPQLPLGITALTGDADATVPVADAAAWEAVCAGDFDLKVFPGDHFYLIPRQADVTAELTRLLRAAAPDIPAQRTPYPHRTPRTSSER